MDVKTASLDGDLEEEIYMQELKGFEEKGKKNHLCWLRKSLYGRKQAPQQQCKKFESFMVDHGFYKTQADHCVFVKNSDRGDFLILSLYVDDMLIVGHDLKKIMSLKRDLIESFAMKDMGLVKQILGMNIVWDQTKRNM